MTWGCESRNALHTVLKLERRVDRGRGVLALTLLTRSPVLNKVQRLTALLYSLAIT